MSNQLDVNEGYFNVYPQISFYSNYGLAMSRALGHKFFSQYGIIPDPTLRNVPVHDGFHYLVVTSDGVSDVLDCQELFNFIHTKKGKRLSRLADAIVKESMSAWKRKYPSPNRASQITDNITVIIVDLLSLCKSKS